MYKQNWARGKGWYFLYKRKQAFYYNIWLYTYMYRWCVYIAKNASLDTYIIYKVITKIRARTLYSMWNTASSSYHVVFWHQWMCLVKHFALLDWPGQCDCPSRFLPPTDFQNNLPNAIVYDSNAIVQYDYRHSFVCDHVAYMLWLQRWRESLDLKSWKTKSVVFWGGTPDRTWRMCLWKMADVKPTEKKWALQTKRINTAWCRSVLLVHTRRWACHHILIVLRLWYGKGLNTRIWVRYILN